MTVNPLGALKCVIYIDYDFPGSKLEEKETVYLKIIDNIIRDMDKQKLGYKYKLCPDYNTYSTIIIFKTTNGVIGYNDWREKIIEVVKNNTDISVEYKGETELYTIDYTVEFSYAEAYSVYH